METLGERIRRIRTEKRISRTTLARGAGIAYSTLSDIETDRTAKTVALHRIAARLGVTPEWLETGRGKRDRNTSGEQPPIADVSATHTLLDGDKIADAYAAIRWRYKTAGRKYELERDPEPLVMAYQFSMDPSEANRLALAAALSDRLHDEGFTGDGQSKKSAGGGGSAPAKQLRRM